VEGTSSPHQPAATTMGLCKCLNITDLYCFVHKKPVCQGCIYPDHKTCPVATYVSWLQDPEYEPPACQICKDAITPDNVLRLTCLDMFHPECIDVHCASLPPTTVQSGFTCPTCQTPIVPPPGASSPLAQALLKHLEHAPWMESSSYPHRANGRGGGGGVVLDVDDLSAIRHELDEDAFLSRRLLGPEPPSNPGSHDVTIDILKSGAEGITSRKALLRGPLDGELPEGHYDVDDNKYEKHSISQLWKNLATPEMKKTSLPSPATAPKKAPRRIRLTMKNALFLFALLSTLITVLMLQYSMIAEE